MKHLTICLGILFYLLLPGCKQLDEPLLSEGVVSFPLRPGALWQYMVTDTILNIHDTVEISIPSTITAPNGQLAWLWRIHSPGNSDTLYIVVSKNRLNFYADAHLQYLRIILDYPLNVGKKWETAFALYQVVSMESVTLDARVVDNVTRIIQTPQHIGNEVGANEYWVQPDVGLVKMVDGVWTTVDMESFHHTEWNLLSYHIP